MEPTCGMEGTMGHHISLSDEDEQKQVQTLTLCYSRETLSIVQNLDLTEAESIYSSNRSCLHDQGKIHIFCHIATPASQDLIKLE